MVLPIYHYALKLSVNCGTTCFLRETAPGRKAWLFSSLKLKAASTLSMLAPRAKISEFELTISVIIKTKSEYPLAAIAAWIAA